jgi:hypothetical protein
MQLTSELWKNDDATTLDKQRSLYWHGGNRSKDQRRDEAEQKEVAKCSLCNAPESQEHIVLQCTNPIMKYARDYNDLTITKHHAKLVTMSKGPYRMVLQRCIALWQNQRVQNNIHMWIGRWPVEELTTLDSFGRLSRTSIIQSLHMCTMPMPYEFIYYEAESQCRLSPHTRPHGMMTCSLCRSTPYAAIAT